MFNTIRKGPFLNLNNIFRYSNRYQLIRESDASHTIDMQLIALHIYSLCPSFDIKDVCYRILIHDLDETVLCDIPRDIKYHDAEFKERLDHITKEKLEESGIPNTMVNEIIHCKDEKIVEGQLVIFFDILQAFMKLRKEWKLQRESEVFQDWTDSLNHLRYFMKHQCTIGGELRSVLENLVTSMIDEVRNYGKE